MHSRFFIFNIIIFIVFIFASYCHAYEAHDDYQNALEAKDFELVSGNPNAAVKVVVYLSLSCPGCRGFKSKILPKIKEKYIDRGAVSYVERILLMHRSDKEGYGLLFCTPLEERVKYMNVLMQSIDSWLYSKNMLENLLNIAALGKGVNREELRQCMVSRDTASKIFAVSKDAVQIIKVPTTPSVYVNGVRVEKTHMFEDIEQAIDQALRKGADY